LIRIIVQAIDRFGEDASCRRFPRTARAAEEVRVSDSVEPDRVLQRTDDVCLTDQVIAVE
jgi:hypothetical protein